MANKKRIATSVAAVATAAALLLGGTFAWQSANQTALNEASDVINPGGRLHDDFYIDADGNYNSDIYVENFADDEIFARVKLQEYMEIVINQGVEGAEVVETVVGSKSLNGTRVTDKPTDNTSGYTYEYVTHYFDGTNETDEYWDWTMGAADSAEVWYMPTFNMNKDSLVADRNGMYVDRIGGISNRSAAQYKDYTVWADDGTKDGTEIYDVDSNQNDEVGYDFENLQTYVDEGNIKTVTETHAADLVGNTNGLISMSQWLDLLNDGEDTSNYWVYDTDGWVYWSSPIAAKSTTGLLLDAIELNQVMDDTWYYAINVIGQFCTAGDVDGFYNDGEAPTGDAETLLEEIGAGTGEAADDEEDGEDETLYSTIDLWHDGNDTVSGGEFLIFEAEVYDENGDVIAFTDDVTFSVEEVNGSEAAAMALFESTTMEGNALMVADEIINSGVTQLVVTAAYTDGSGNEYRGTYELDVAEGESPLSISLKIDGKDVSYYRPGIYQMFPANPAADTYSFSASLNDVSANPAWSTAYINEDAPFTTTTGDDGIQIISTSADWDNGWRTVAAGTNIAQINTSTGEFKVLLSNDYYPRGMEFYITASDAESGYENTVMLCLYRVDVNFNLLNADVADQNSIDAHSATYTAGENSEINLCFDLMMNGADATVDMTKLQNWKLYEGYASYNGTLIDSSKYEITTDAANHTAKLTIPADSGIDAEELQLTVEYNHGVIAPRTEDGISEGTLNITEANAAAVAGAVETFVITDEYGEEEATYTSGGYEKIKLTANALTADEEHVYSGYVTWFIVGSNGASTTMDNVTLKSNGFEAEVWLTGATAETITVKAQYDTDEGGVHKDDTFVITAEGSDSGSETTDNTAPTVSSVEGDGLIYTYTIEDVSDADFPMTMNVYWASNENVYAEGVGALYSVEYTLSEDGTVVQTGHGTDAADASVTYENGIVTSKLNTVVIGDGFWGVTVTDASGNMGKLEDPFFVEPAIGCFVAGTQVQTVDGLVNIEDINLGDMVYSIDLTTGAKVVSPVTWVQGSRYIDATYTIYAGGEKVVTTYEHPFYVMGKEWVAAEDLTVGDKIKTVDGQVTITKIVYTELDAPVQVYNFTVDGTHNYLISAAGLLVHNIAEK